MKKDLEKIDYTELLKNADLPMSQKTYEKLKGALKLGRVKWKDLPKELRYAFEDFNFVKSIYILKNKLDSIKDTEKKDYSHLLKTNLPLSQQTYEALGVALVNGHIKWKDMPMSLNHAFQAFDKDNRAKAFQKGIDEGKWQDWE